MVAAVESMAYAGDVPWHKLGVKVSNDMTPEQMLKAAGLEWTVSKRKLYLELDGKMSEYPDHYALVRDTDNKLLKSECSHTWKITQNSEAADFFKKFIVAGHMQMETMGSLWDGRYVWCLARVKKSFMLGKNDEVESFLLFCLPHIHGKALAIQFTPIRVVCWNTLTFALGANLKGKGDQVFRLPHSAEFNDAVKQRAEQALGIAQKQTDEFQELAQLLVKKKADEKLANSYFCDVLRFDPKKAEKEGEREPRMLPKFRAALAHSPGADMPSARGTLWGALNAVTYVIDHESGRDEQTKLKNIWLGHLAGVKRTAVDVAVEYAKRAKGA